MSTTTPSPRLCDRLVDDAAVFPPVEAPVDRAWQEHVARRETAWAGCVGPLLVAPAHTELLATVARAEPPGWPVATVLVARPGVPLGEVDEAMAVLEPVPDVRIVGVEVSHGPTWRDALLWQLPLAVEVGRDAADRDQALDDIMGARAQGHPVTAKLRTQTTTDRALPTPEELAGFLLACASRGVPFKLTGGLHHGVAGDVLLPQGTTEWQHGVVNVLSATHAAGHGCGLDHLVALLGRQDGPALAAHLLALTADETERLREAFTSFGCCDVLDPLRDLAGLGLLVPDPAHQEETV
jgi:hypothetical protein